MSDLTIKIGELWTGSEGTSKSFSLDMPVDLKDPEIKPTSNLKAEVSLYKLKGQITAVVRDFELDIELQYADSGKKFVYPIRIAEIERQFLPEQPKKVEDLFDLYLINLKDQTIDLTEMLRQEIILHFPMVSVDSKSLNKKLSEKYMKSGDDPDSHKPFKDLKKLIK
ncbi:hypothetical protein GF340_00880 [Candidatus Peregrinibacteria bacterium]|nr:hypothetical protein [Candidatus Peregrinibacteria bacterium]